jgi:hypothetical protein
MPGFNKKATKRKNSYDYSLFTARNSPPIFLLAAHLFYKFVQQASIFPPFRYIFNNTSVRKKKPSEIEKSTLLFQKTS